MHRTSVSGLTALLVWSGSACAMECNRASLNQINNAKELTTLNKETLARKFALGWTEP